MLRAIIRRGGRSWDAAQRSVQRLGLGQVAALARRLLREPPASSPEAVSDWQAQTLAALTDRLCHDPSGRLPLARDCGAVDASVRFISKMPPARQTQLRQIITLFEAGSLLFPPRGERSRFSALSPEARDSYIEGWAESTLVQRRAVFHGLKSVCMMGYWSCPQTWAEIGYSVQDNPGLPQRARARVQENP